MGNGFDLGSVYGKITLDASGVTSGINAARQALNTGFANMGSGLQSFGDQMTGLGGRITALTAPFTALSVSGLKTAADFDVLMKQVELFGGVTGAELEAVRQYALQMGRDTQFSAQDAGGALLDLLKSGQSLEEAMATLPEVLDLAAVGQMSLTQAAGITTGGLAQFQLGATASEEITNALAQAASASRADVTDLGQALANVGPIASNFGLDVEETSAILGVFANNNIMGAEAGTQLKSMLLNLTRPTNEVEEAYAELGVSLYDAEGNVRDFNTVMLELDGALDTLPVERQNELMQQLGGSYGIVGVSALRASNGIGDMMAEMAAAPDAGTLAGGFMDTVAGKMESLKGSFETFKIEAFTPFMNDVVAPFLDRMVLVVNGITEWVSANPELTTTLLQIGSAIAVAGPALIGVGTAIGTIGKVVGIAAPLLGLLTSPLGLMAGAGLVLAKVFDVDLRQAFEDTLEVVIPVLESLRVWFVEDALPAIVDFVQNTFLPIVGQIGSALAETWTRIYPVLEGLYNWFVNDAIPAIVDIIETVFIPIIQDIGTRIGEVWAVIAPVLVQIYDWFVTTAIPAVANAIETIFVPAIQFIATVFKEIYETVAPILQFLITWFVEQGIPIIVSIIEAAVPVFQTISDVLGAIWSVVGPVLQSLLDWFQTTGFPFIESIINEVITPAINTMIDLFTGIWSAIEPYIQQLVDFWEDTLGPIIQFVVDKIIIPAVNGLVGIIQGILPLVEPALNLIKDVFVGIFTWIADNVIKPLIDTILSIPRAVDEALKAIERFLQGAPKNKISDTANQILSPGALPNVQQGITTGSFVQDMQQSALGQGGAFMPSMGGIIRLPKRDSGGEGLAMMPYLIGNSQLNKEALIGNSGKIYVAPEDGEFVPNFMDKMNNQQSGAVYNITIHANNAQGGKDAGEAFVQRLKQLERAGGG